jgi:hypothetical protein
MLHKELGMPFSVVGFSEDDRRGYRSGNAYLRTPKSGEPTNRKIGDFPAVQIGNHLFIPHISFLEVHTRLSLNGACEAEIIAENAAIPKSTTLVGKLLFNADKWSIRVAMLNVAWNDNVYGTYGATGGIFTRISKSWIPKKP